MEQLLYAIVGLVARIHNFILSWNDSIETSFTDKELHFLVIGVLGTILLVAYSKVAGRSKGLKKED